jgi:hypothetical protein
MTDRLKLDKYKQQIADLYSDRSAIAILLENPDLWYNNTQLSIERL